MKRVLLLSRYGNLGASSRLRSYQYVPYLEEHGFEITLAPLLKDDYVKGLYNGHIPLFSVFKAFIDRLGQMLRAGSHDLVWVEKEMLPWLPGWLELGLFPGGIPLVADYDDAVFHRYDQHRNGLVRAFFGKKIDRVLRFADLVVVGNAYLEDHARAAGAKRVEMLPTVVDTARYRPCSDGSGHPVTVGWIGSPATAQYLNLIRGVLSELSTFRHARLVAVGANESQLADFPVEVRDWSEATEVAEIQQFDIGIMPLPDESWERGKCGYKLIQYMACAKPVIASPVGVNANIVRNGVNGFLATGTEEWRKAFEILCRDPGLRKEMGMAGRKRVEREFSLEVAAPKLEQMLRSVAR